MHFRKIEYKIPVFFGCLGSLVLCALLAIHLQNTMLSFEARTPEPVPEVVEESSGSAVKYQFFTRVEPQRHDIILELYRQPETRDRVVEYFTEIADVEIAEIILANADIFDISPALAIALSWEESRLNPLAVNNNNRNDSIDRGLFQLNSRSFPFLETQDFFNPAMNAYYGISHLRHCMDTGGTEISALAMYNAGTGRVRNTGTPKTTLDYISRIMDNRWKIESHFLEQENQFQVLLEEATEFAEREPERSPFVLLKPLGIR